MTTVYLCPTMGIAYQCFTQGGIPLAGGLIYTYAAGTTTPLETYTTSAGTVQNANPIVLDAGGRPPGEIWLTGVAYAIKITDSLGNLIRTYDNVSGLGAGAGSVGSAIQLQTYTAYTTGGTSAAYTLTPTPALAANVANAEYWVTFHTAAGSSPTLAVSGNTALPLVYRDSAGAEHAVTNSQVLSLWSSRVVCNASATSWVLLDIPFNASSGSSSAQIFPISASVGSNALTISASALSLDFRSTTLGSGTVTTVTGTPANLVISSGSTLGTVSGTQSYIAVLALNNAGTIELAVVNISGGVDLSETGVVSTTAEGGAGAADSATVVYSTTARTNLAYRVIGVIGSIQATAGTWATAPSLIQGVGGQAFTSLMSVGYSQTPTDVHASRAAGTTYYNTTPKPIFVSCCFTSTGTAKAQLSVNGVVFYGSGASAGYPIYVGGIVPTGMSYSATVDAGAPTILGWTELR